MDRAKRGPYKKDQGKYSPSMVPFWIFFVLLQVCTGHGKLVKCSISTLHLYPFPYWTAPFCTVPQG